MSGIEGGHHMAVTPTKKSIHQYHNRCAQCPCQQFQSDTDVTSAVDSDARTDALIGWLSGTTSTANNDNENGSVARVVMVDAPAKKLCPNRLQASVAILNSIRDACRPYLETSTPIVSLTNATAAASPSPKKAVATYEDSFPSLSSTSSSKNVGAPTVLVGRKKSKGPPKKNNLQQNQSSGVDNSAGPTYEDSFPSLSSNTSSAAVPTMLVGRKKSKGPKSQPKTNTNAGPTYEDSFPSISSNTSSTAAPTMLVGRKKSKGPKSNINTKANDVQIGFNTKTKSIPSQQVPSIGKANAAPPKAKKKIKPITISASPISSTSSAFTPVSSNNQQAHQIKLEGNISSLPSQDTSEVFGTSEASHKKSVESSVNNMQSKSDNESPAAKDGTSSTGTDKASVDNEHVAVKPISPDNLQKLKRLVNIYSTILKAHLAPFLLLELHLLVRLVSLCEKPTIAESKTTQFSCIFQSEHSCRDFAAQTLTALEVVIVNMGYETIKLFVALPAIQTHCPGLCMSLQDVIYADNSRLIFETDQKALGSNANTPHLTLPFDHARDSRHNYRSVDLGRLFKEREELRDSFLYQLRAFQDVKGKLMEHEQAEKQMEHIRKASREMLNSVSTGNALWLVKFFCDLLLQVGLVPISETDSEVLKQIGDKKRLQKLHMRFTSKSGQTNNSSRKLRIDHKGPSSNATTAAPEQSFSGHQEFFSMFLRAGDSHRFNIHLQRHLSQLIQEMNAVNETKGLCDHIAKTQMLAKFLGMLVFSPNWDLPSSDMNSGCIEVIPPPINIQDCIESAWEQSRLVVVIPWIVQFLSMMRWDEASKGNQYYIRTFALLWSISQECVSCQAEQHSFSRTNMLLLSFQLDTLFHDVVGLGPAQKLPANTLPKRKLNDTADTTIIIPFDNLPLWFSKSFLFPSVPYLKDLCELLKDLTQNSGKAATTGSAKKRRSVVTNLGGDDSIQHSVSQISFTGDKSMSPWASNRPGTPINKGGIKERLVDSFFHQHRDLQQLCELVIDRAMKNFSVTVTHSCIQPIFQNGATSFEEYLTKTPAMTLDEYMKLLKDLDSKASKEASALMNEDFNRIINGTLHLLAPSETNSQVVSVASSLSINDATQKGTSTIRSIIGAEKKRLVQEFSQKEKKVKAGVPLSNAAKKRQAIQVSLGEKSDTKFDGIANLVVSMKDIHELGDANGDRLMRLKQEKETVVGYSQKCFFGTGISPALVEFEQELMSILKDFFANPSSKSLYLLLAVIEATEVLALMTRLGYAGASNEELETVICNSSNMLSLMEAVKSAQTTQNPANHLSHETIGDFLFTLVEGCLINYLAIEGTLLQTVKVNDDAKVVSRILLNNLASSRAGSLNTTDTTDGLVIMIRLQRLVMRDDASV